MPNPAAGRPTRDPAGAAARQRRRPRPLPPATTTALNQKAVPAESTRFVYHWRPRAPIRPPPPPDPKNDAAPRPRPELGAAASGVELPGRAPQQPAVKRASIPRRPLSLRKSRARTPKPVATPRRPEPPPAGGRDRTPRPGAPAMGAAAGRRTPHGPEGFDLSNVPVNWPSARSCQSGFFARRGCGFCASASFERRDGVLPLPASAYALRKLLR
jgi:hypothetical protein